MDFIRTKNDSDTVWVQNNDIENALRLLHKQLTGNKSFKEIKKPRKTKHHRQRRQFKRLKMYQSKKIIAMYGE